MKSEIKREETKENLEEFRRKVREQREREWIRDSLLLRGRKPEETISLMFDLLEFAEKLSKARKCEA